MYFCEIFNRDCQEKIDKGSPYGIKDLTGEECVHVIHKVLDKYFGYVPSGTDFVSIRDEQCGDHPPLCLFRQILRRYTPKFIDFDMETYNSKIDLRSVRHCVRRDGPITYPRHLLDSSFMDRDKLHEAICVAWPEKGRNEGEDLYYRNQWKILADCVNYHTRENKE